MTAATGAASTAAGLVALGFGAAVFFAAIFFLGVAIFAGFFLATAFFFFTGFFFGATLDAGAVFFLAFLGAIFGGRFFFDAFFTPAPFGGRFFFAAVFLAAFADFFLAIGVSLRVVVWGTASIMLHDEGGKFCRTFPPAGLSSRKCRMLSDVSEPRSHRNGDSRTPVVGATLSTRLRRRKALPVRSSRYPRLTTAERRCSIAKVRPDIGQKQ